MKPIPLNEETAAVATQIIWFEPPSEALADPVRFMAYAMTYAIHEQMRVLRESSTLAHGPIGIPKWADTRRRRFPCEGSEVALDRIYRLSRVPTKTVIPISRGN